MTDSPPQKPVIEGTEHRDSSVDISSLGALNALELANGEHTFPNAPQRSDQDAPALMENQDVLTREAEAEASIAPRLPGVPLPDLYVLTQETLEAIRESDAGITVAEINRQVCEKLGIDTRQLIRPEQGETPFLYRMRYARMVLWSQARLIERYPSVGTWEYDSHVYRLSVSSAAAGAADVGDLVDAFLAQNPLGRNYEKAKQRPFGLEQPLGIGRRSPWDYDYSRWCYETLQSARYLCGGHANFGVASNNDINEELARRMGLSIDQRRVRSLINPTELEYKARGGTMRALLDRLGLIRRAQYAKKYWSLTEHSSQISQQSLGEAIQALLERGGGAPPAPWFPNETYRGNLALESHTAGDLSASTGPDPFEYDYKSWCFETLSSVQDVCSDNEAVGIEGADNIQISERLAVRLRLSDAQKNVRNIRNPVENEYKARSASMRSLLERLGMIERMPSQFDPSRRLWRVTSAGEAGLASGSIDDSIDGLMGSYGSQLTASYLGVDTYRGNVELERLEPGPVSEVEDSSSNSAYQNDGPEERSLGDTPQVDSLGSSRVPTDIELCVATFRVLAEEPNGLGQAEVVERVAKSLGVEEYRRELPPPWCRKRRNLDSLYEYRMEHALRALSVFPSNLIRVRGGEEVDEELDGTWCLTEDGRNLALESLGGSGDTSLEGKMVEMVSDYFEIHSYQDWKTQEWMSEYVEYVRRTWGSDGTPFEFLCAALLHEAENFAVVRVQDKNSEMDQKGVDIVAKTQLVDTNEVVARFGSVEVNRTYEAIWFVQCKWGMRGEPTGDVASKVGMYWITRKWQAEEYHVGGARLICGGDLSRQATQMYWNIRAIAQRDDPDDEDRANTWDLWDGGRVLRLMEEYRVGVEMSSAGAVVGVDKKFLAGLGDSG